MKNNVYNTEKMIKLHFYAYYQPELLVIFPIFFFKNNKLQKVRKLSKNKM